MTKGRITAANQWPQVFGVLRCVFLYSLLLGGFNSLEQIFESLLINDIHSRKLT